MGRAPRTPPARARAAANAPLLLDDLVGVRAAVEVDDDARSPQGRAAPRRRTDVDVAARGTFVGGDLTAGDGVARGGVEGALGRVQERDPRPPRSGTASCGSAARTSRQTPICQLATIHLRREGPRLPLSGRLLRLVGAGDRPGQPCGASARPTRSCRGDVDVPDEPPAVVQLVEPELSSTVYESSRPCPGGARSVRSRPARSPAPRSRGPPPSRPRPRGTRAMYPVQTMPNAHRPTLTTRPAARTAG